MPQDLNQNSLPQPADGNAPADLNTIQAVADMQKRDAEERLNAQVAKKGESLDEIQEKLRKNKAFFYGLPIAVVGYGALAVFFFVVPSIQTFFKVNDSITVLNRNLNTLKTSASNLREARSKINDYDKYTQEVTSYVPTDSQLGALIDNIQKKAGDFGLQSEVGLPTRETVANNSTIESIADRDENDNGLFDSINSGEIDFVPQSVISPNSKAKLLAIDVNIKGNKESFFNFLKSMEQSKPIINLVYVDYQETSADTQSSESSVRATIRFESYALKLGEQNILVSETLTPQDPSLLAPFAEEVFDINTSIIEEFEAGEN